MQILTKSIYSLSIVFWVGSIFFFSFFAAPSIFKVLPRELAGNVVADIFPKYYLVSYICGFLALISLFISLNKGYIQKNQMNLYAIILIIIMLGLSVFSGTYLRGKVAEVKQEVRSVEQSSSDYKVLKIKFGKLHGVSAIINIIIFVFGIALVIINTYNISVE